MKGVEWRMAVIVDDGRVLSLFFFCRFRMVDLFGICVEDEALIDVTFFNWISIWEKGKLRFPFFGGMNHIS